LDQSISAAIFRVNSIGAVRGRQRDEEERQLYRYGDIITPKAK
jgi:hypothetical protein